MTDFYKHQAKKYAKFAENSFTWKFIEKPSFEKHIGKELKNDWKVLDAGCGEGRVIEFLLSKK